MSTAVGELRVDITGDWADFRTNLQRSGDALGRFGTKAGQVAGEFAKAGVRIAAVAATAVAAFAVMGTRAAEEADSARDAFRDAFGDMSDQALAWSTRTADAFDLTDRAIQDQARSFQNLFGEIAPTNEAASELSQRFTVLANDFAALKNISPEQAVQRFQAALGGSARAMRQYGVDLSETVVRNEALRLGIITTDQELSNEQATLIRASILMRELGDATGSYAEDQDSAEAATRRLRTESDELSVTLGDQLLPVMNSLKASAAGLLKAFNDFVSGVSARLTASDTWVTRLYQVREALRGNFVSYTEAARALAQVRAEERANAGQTSATAGAIRGLTDDTQQYADTIIELAREAKGGGMREGARSWAEEHAADIERLRAALDPAAELLRQYTEQMEIARRANIEFSDAQRATFVEGMIEAAGGVHRFKGELEGLPQVFQDVANRMHDAEIAERIQEYRDELKEFATDLNAEFNGESALEIRLARIDEAFAANLISMKTWVEARRAAMEEHNGVTNDLDEVNERIAADADRQRERWSGVRRALADVATGTRSIEDAWKDLLLQFLRAQAIEPFLNRIIGGGAGGGKNGGFNPQQLFGGIGNFVGGLFGGGKANGGDVFKGMAYEVGERGRELFVPESDGQIVPNGGYGGTTINVYTPDANSFRASRRQIARSERRAAGVE